MTGGHRRPERTCRSSRVTRIENEKYALRSSTSQKLHQMLAREPESTHAVGANGYGGPLGRERNHVPLRIAFLEKGHTVARVVDDENVVRRRGRGEDLLDRGSVGRSIEEGGGVDTGEEPAASFPNHLHECSYVARWIGQLERRVGIVADSDGDHVQFWARRWRCDGDGRDLRRWSIDISVSDTYSLELVGSGGEANVESAEPLGLRYPTVGNEFPVVVEPDRGEQIDGIVGPPLVAPSPSPHRPPIGFRSGSDR